MSTKEFFNMTAKERAELASQVKAVRLQVGLTQQELADEAGVTRQSVGNIESGGITPQAKTLLPVLEVLGIVPARAEFSAETSLWLSIVGGIMDSLPQERRARAGQAAVSAVTQELVSAADNVIVGSFGNNDDADEVDLPENIEDEWAGQYAAHPKGDEPEDHTP